MESLDGVKKEVEQVVTTMTMLAEDPHAEVENIKTMLETKYDDFNGNWTFGKDFVEENWGSEAEEDEGEDEEDKEDEEDEDDEDEEAEVVEDVQLPLPQCAVNETFSVSFFTIRDKPVQRCRSKSGRFAPTVCCSPALELLKSQQLAQEVCENVLMKYCKIDGLTKRKKAVVKINGVTKRIPDTHDCKRMYKCVEQGAGKEAESLGPVLHQRMCRKDKTGLTTDRMAKHVCIAYRQQSSE